MTHSDPASAPAAAPVRTPRRARVLKRADREAAAAAAAAERETAADLETIRIAARDAGYRDGLEAAERAAAARGLALAMDAQDQVRQVEAALTEAVLRGVEQIIGEIDSVTLARRVARAALREIRQVGAIAIHTAPETAEALRAEVDTLQRLFPGFAFIAVTPDAEVPAGGALLKTSAGVIDARLETQLAALRDSLEAAHASATADADDDAPVAEPGDAALPDAGPQDVAA